MEIDDFKGTMPDSERRRRQLRFLPGDMIGERYEYVRDLGRGGMGVVMLCRDSMAGNREMAVKTVPDILRDNDAAVADMMREYNNMYDLTHDGVVAVRNLVKDAFRYYVVMDYAKGETLEAYLMNYRKPGLAITREVVCRLAAVLDYAHGKGLVHRDVKPANVMVEIDGQSVKSVKLLDFGLGLQIRKSFSLTTGNMATSGTPAYKSPEQWNLKRYGKPSAKSDQYSLAALAYEMLDGAFPFSEYDDLETFRMAVLSDEPEPIDGLADYANAALRKALSKRQEDRFESCMAFANALSTPSSIQTAPSVVTPPSVPAIEKKDMTIMLPGDVPLELVYIHAGSFWMGSPKDELGRSDDEIPHRVTLTQDFWLGKYSVTQRQWIVVMGSNPSYFQNGDRYPVEQVSWYDAMAFCQKLTERERSAGRLPAGYEYTLPTEAQWEYACRAGTTTPYSFGSALNGDKANCNGDYPYGGVGKGRYLERTSKVGSYAPNAWGLYDMIGNVHDWCRDWYGDYPTGSATDPAGPSSGLYRVLRGGTWAFSASDCRSAKRSDRQPAYGYYWIGFRVALAAVQ